MHRTLKWGLVVVGGLPLPGAAAAGRVFIDDGAFKVTGPQIAPGAPHAGLGTRATLLAGSR